MAKAFVRRCRGLAGCLLAAGLLLSGCGKDTTAGGGAGSNQVRIAYIGLTCEAPLFVAYEKGFFKEEGLDAEMVKVDWTTMREGLGTGNADATHTLITYVLKPVEQGLDVRMTGGVHKGCLKIQAGVKTSVKTIADLKGKKIGIQSVGSPPYLYAHRVLADNGIDPKDVEWRVYPASEMELALEKGDIDAVANSEPIGSLLLAHKKVMTLPGADQSVDSPYKDEFCCVTVVSGAYLAKNPAGAAKVTRAILKGAKWVSANATAAAKISVEAKWLSSTVELNALALSQLHYEPSVDAARESVRLVANALKRENMLNPGTNPDELAKKAFMPLEGVTDEWINGLKIETVAGGGKFVPADPMLITLTGVASCCAKSIQ